MTVDLGPTFENHDDIAAFCLTCKALLMRGNNESEQDFIERARAHAARHVETEAWP